MKFNGYSHEKGCQLSAQINFPESLVSFYTTGQVSVLPCILRSVYIKGSDPHKAREFHLIYSATLI